MDNPVLTFEPAPYRRLDQSVPSANVLLIPTAPPTQEQPVFGYTSEMQASVNFGPKPQIANCPYCHTQQKTKVNSKALCKAHCWACIFFWIGFWPCICCPYCCCDCSKKFHHCGNCNAFLGTYDP